MAAQITKRFRAPSHWTLAQKIAHRSVLAPNGCRIWTAATNVKGYGITRAHGHSALAHRAAWEDAHGPIPPEMLVCHTCDNPRCVAISHLFLGSNDDNMADRSAKGRQARGEAIGRATLTAELVMRIRATPGPQKVVASTFGISTSAVSKIRNRKLWAHI